MTLLTRAKQRQIFTAVEHAWQHSRYGVYAFGSGEFVSTPYSCDLRIIEAWVPMSPLDDVPHRFYMQLASSTTAPVHCCSIRFLHLPRYTGRRGLWVLAIKGMYTSLSWYEIHQPASLCITSHLQQSCRNIFVISQPEPHVDAVLRTIALVIWSPDECNVLQLVVLLSICSYDRY